tara:strand:+ start:209 stop:382 length:174 start_codon:yes stop_codon:yes gene_type:complete
MEYITNILNQYEQIGVSFFLLSYMLFVTVGIEKLSLKGQLIVLSILASANIFCAFFI